MTWLGRHITRYRDVKRTDKMNENEATIVVEHKMGASAERVFDAWIDPAMIALWFAPELGPFERIDVDARVGGRFSIAQVRAERSTEDVSEGVVDHIGEYLVMDRPHHLRFTFGIASLEGSESTVDVKIGPLSEGCQLTLTTSLPAEWAHYTERTREGWSTLVASIDDVVSRA